MQIIKMGTGEIQCPFLIFTDIFSGRFSDAKIKVY